MLFQSRFCLHWCVLSDGKRWGRKWNSVKGDLFLSGWYCVKSNWCGRLCMSGDVHCQRFTALPLCVGLLCVLPWSFSRAVKLCFPAQVWEVEKCVYGQFICLQCPICLLKVYSFTSNWWNIDVVNCSAGTWCCNKKAIFPDEERHLVTLYVSCDLLKLNCYNSHLVLNALPAKPVHCARLVCDGARMCVEREIVNHSSLLLREGLPVVQNQVCLIASVVIGL